MRICDIEVKKTKVNFEGEMEYDSHEGMQGKFQSLKFMDNE